MRDHGAGPDHRAPADLDIGKYGRVGADRGAPSDHRARELAGPILASWKAIIGEGCVRANEDVVLDRDAVPQLHPAFHRDAVANDHVVLDEDPVANIAIRANRRPGEDVGKGMDARS